MTGKLDGHVAIVTGAGSGLGAAAARAMAREGAHVMLTDINEDTGRAVLDEILGSGGSAAFHRHDVADERAWMDVIAVTLEKFTRLDCLVNNAGMVFITPVEETQLADFRKLNDINLKGCFLGLKHGVEAMRKNASTDRPGGAVINISSIIGKVGAPGLVAYAASKGGIRLMTKAAAIELGPENIRVNSVHPGTIGTDLAREALGEMMPVVEAAIPMGHVGEPMDIGEGVCFLASPDADFMTGTELVIDGGSIATYNSGA